MNDKIVTAVTGDAVFNKTSETEKGKITASEDQGTVEIYIGNQVLELLSDNSFLEKWDVLYHDCPWATVFQSKEFVANWYNIYSKNRLPILVKAECENELVGLLPVSQKKNNLITGLGEYHVWLSKQEDGDAFIQIALLELGKKFPNTDFQFRFLPGTAPLDWIASRQWKQKCVLISHTQPLMTIDETYILQELRKKNRREKINRLKRLGELRFEEIKDRDAFICIFDDIAAQYDFRKGAMYNKSRFLHSPLPKRLLIALFDAGLLHVSILKINDEIIASNVGTKGKPWIHLSGMNSHSPLYSKYSPGILHFLMLCRSLAEEGFLYFDLTPGGESYKDGLATNHANAYELRIAGSAGEYFKSVLAKRFEEYISREDNVLNTLNKTGLLPKVRRNDKQNALRKFFIYLERLRNAKQKGLGSFLSELVGFNRKNKQYAVYNVSSKVLKNSSIILQKDNLHDLLKYKPAGRELTRIEFLSEAMAKFESGFHVYTLADDCSLQGSIWFMKQPTGTALKSLGTSSPVDEASFLLFDIFYRPEMDESIEEFIAAAVAVALGENTTGRIQIAVNESDSTLHKKLQKAGFIQAPGKVELNFLKQAQRT